MSIIYYEARKMLIHQKGLLLVLLYFLFSFGGLLVFHTSANPDIEQNRVAYDFYLHQVEGPCTVKTEKFLTDEAVRITDAQSGLQKAYNDYYDGKITKQNFDSQIKTQKAILQYKNGFDIIYDQYTQIKGNTGNRYFLYTNGWNGLLSNDNLDLLFVILLLLLITPVFCHEYECQMNFLILTERKGGRYHALCKIMLVLLLVTFFSIVSSGMQYAFYQIRYGLPDGNYPLQSLPYFETSSQKITLFEAFLFVSAGRLFGSLCFAALILFVSVCVQRYALTLLPCSAVILLPYLGFHLQSSKYFLPGPLGFMISTGFLRGNEYQVEASTQEKLIIFQEIPAATRTYLLLITLCIAAAMTAVVFLRNTNAWCVRRHSWKIRQPLCLLMLLCFLALPGCTAENKEETSAPYNMELADSFENQSYRFYAKSSNPGDKQIVFENKKTGKVQSLVRDPMQSLMKVPACIYGDGYDVYYLKYSLDKSKGGFRGSSYNSFSVIQVDTHDFTEKIIYEKNLNKDHDSFLGFGSLNDPEANFFMPSVEAFFVDSHNIYFVNENQIRKVNRLTGQMSVVVDSPVLKTVAFDGKIIYYMNDESQIIRFDPSTNMKSAIPDVATSSFILIKNRIIYINRNDSDRLYAISLANNAKRKIVNDRVLSFTVDGNNIVYTNQHDLKQCRIKITD